MLISTNWPVLFCCFSFVIYLSGCEFWGPYELMVPLKRTLVSWGGGGQDRGSESSASRTTFSRLPYFCPPLPPDSHPSLSCSRLPNKKIALKSEPLHTLRRAHWSGIPLKQVCKFCRKQGSQQRPSLFSRQIFLTVGRLVSGTVTHGCSGEQNGGHWCSNYGLYFFQILVLCKILRAAFRDTLYLCISRVKIWFMAISATVWILCDIVHTLNFLHVPFKNLSYVVPILENIVLKEENS